MPFAKGNQLGRKNLGRRKDRAKTLWLLESLGQQGFDFEHKLVTLLEKAIKGDKVALEAAHLLVKLVPHVANAPKNDAGLNQIETLVINRYELPAPPKAETIETTATEGTSTQSPAV